MRPTRSLLGLTATGVLLCLSGCGSAGRTAAAGPTPTPEVTATSSAGHASATPGHDSTTSGGATDREAGACAGGAGEYRPTPGCTLTLAVGSHTDLVLPPLYDDGAGVFTIRPVQGASLRTDGDALRDGIRRVSVTAVAPGTTTVTASAEGPGGAPGAMWPFTVTVP